jgi:hypothetical protein
VRAEQLWFDRKSKERLRNSRRGWELQVENMKSKVMTGGQEIQVENKKCKLRTGSPR